MGDRFIRAFPICDLHSGLMGDVSVIGVVIASERPRLISKQMTSPVTKRYVCNFTIRDERGDTINVSVWGMIDFVEMISDRCGIGAFVQVCNPRIREIVGDKDMGVYLPMVSSKHRLILDEKVYSMVKIFKGEEDEYGFSITSKLEASFHIPLYSSCRKVTVMDLHKENSRVFVGDIVTAVAIVVSVGPVMKNKKKDGRISHRQEIKLMDHSTKEKHISLILWDSILQTYASEWIPRNTVLQLTSVKYCLDRYSNRKILVSSPCTVITMDPNTDEGEMLTKYARTSLPDSASLSRILAQMDELGPFNRNQAKKTESLAFLHHLAQKLEIGARQQFLFQAFVKDIKLNQVQRIIQTKCPNCGVRSEENGPTLCKTAQCYANKISTVLYFDFYISAFDSSGMISQLRLGGEFAEKILNISPKEFVNLSDFEKKKMENIFHLERCEIGIQMEHRFDGKRVLTVLHMEPISQDSAY